MRTQNDRRGCCLYTILEYSVLARLSAHADWISCMYLAQYPRLPFCGLIYIQLIHLWRKSTMFFVLFFLQMTSDEFRAGFKKTFWKMIIFHGVVAVSRENFEEKFYQYIKNCKKSTIFFS